MSPLDRPARAALTGYSWSALFDAIQKSHYKSGKVQKLETAVKVYAGLTKVSTLRKAILRKLTSLLRHPFAKVSGILHSLE